MSIGSHLAITATIDDQQGNETQINVSASQQMLSQRIALNASMLAQSPPEERGASLRSLDELVIEMETAHEWLISNDDRVGFSPDENPELNDIYFGTDRLDVKVRSFLVTARNVIDTPPDRLTPASTPILALTRFAQDGSDSGLLATLDRASHAYVDSSAQEVGAVLRVVRIVLFVTLAALIIEGLWVFRPMVRRLTEQTESINRARSRLQAVLDNALVGVITLDTRGTIVDMNTTARALFARNVGLVGGRFSRLAIDIDDREVLRRLIDDASAGRRPPPTEISLAGADGVFLARISAQEGASASGRFISVVVTDETNRRRAESELRYHATHDSLTDLPNRALFKEQVDTALRDSINDGATPAVMFIDIDDFKTINDSLGHLVGDQLLSVVGQRLAGCIRSTDTAARLGGDEFAVLVPRCADAGVARGLADRVLMALSSPIIIGSQQLAVTASIGIAVGAPGDDSTSMLSNADNAMYSAKRKGKAQLCFFTAELHADAMDRLDLRVGITQALCADEFSLHYQPIVNLQTEEVNGIEALIRWEHPDRGPIRPDQFIPVAEETGQIVAIGWWVLEHAIADVIELRNRAGVDAPSYVSVNVSPAQFMAEDFVDRLETLLGDRLAGSALVLELTETALMRDSIAVADTLVRLRELGVRVAIDDFGTGYSSLSYLHTLAVDILKIDRSFVSQITEDADAPLVLTLLQMAQSLGLDVIAEGVETAAQRQWLLDMGCPTGQGFHFAKPIDFAATCELLRSSSVTCTPVQ
ncbi:MAG: EAL domain-containing protein [Ilumatobacter sp.]